MRIKKKAAFAALVAILLIAAQGAGVLHASSTINKLFDYSNLLAPGQPTPAPTPPPENEPEEEPRYRNPQMSYEPFRYITTGGARHVILSFDVDDVDEQYRRLLSMDVETINRPTTHPWGARSFHFRDPDGNVINFRGRG